MWKLKYNRGNSKQDKKITLRIEGNICKLSNWKGLMSKYTNSSCSSISNNKHPNHKTCGRHKCLLFSEEDIHVAKRHMKKCSTSLVTRKMQNKTPMRYHFILVRMTIIKKKKTYKL